MLTHSPFLGVGGSREVYCLQKLLSYIYPRYVYTISTGNRGRSHR